MKIDYTLWPNANGNLGEIKTPIPDGVTTQWPEGDALVGNFVYKDGLLSGFVDTKALVANELGETTINYDFVDVKFDSIVDGTMVINQGPRCKYFTVSVAPYVPDFISFEEMSEDDKTLLRSATKIVNDVLYDADDNEIGTYKTINLTSGSNIVLEGNSTILSTDGKAKDALFTPNDIENSVSSFREIPLTTFESSLASLKNGQYMFNSSNLTTFIGDLSSLENGEYMFQGCREMTTFKTNADSTRVDLSSLKNGAYMFYQCNGLTSFEADLSSLTYGKHMFYHCKSLADFDCDLSSLTNGYAMFSMCALSTSALKNIARTIKDVTGLTNGADQYAPVYKTIHFALSTYNPSDEDKEYLTIIHNKGWRVYTSTIFGSTEFIPA